jgi:hypothetical protein
MAVILPKELAYDILMCQYQNKIWLINQHFYSVWKKVLHNYRQTTIPPSIKIYEYKRVYGLHYKRHACKSPLFECTLFNLALAHGKLYTHILRQYRATTNGDFKIIDLQEQGIVHLITNNLCETLRAHSMMVSGSKCKCTSIDGEYIFYQQQHVPNVWKEVVSDIKLPLLTYCKYLKHIGTELDERLIQFVTNGDVFPYLR